MLRACLDSFWTLCTWGARLPRAKLKGSWPICAFYSLSKAQLAARCCCAFVRMCKAVAERAWQRLLQAL